MILPSSLTLPSISSGVKPKLDLLRTCVAAIPRILPEGMSKEDLLDLLSRLTIHMDNEIVRTTMISLTGIITNFPSWRHNVIRIYALFILREVPDNCPLTLESALKFLIQMVTHWKGLITAETSQVSNECPVCVGCTHVHVYYRHSEVNKHEVTLFSVAVAIEKQ